MIGHLGDRVSALLDGQLSEEEQERAWGHVHSCHACRDLVEREGWVKTRLVGLSYAADPAPTHLASHIKGSMLAAAVYGVTPGEALLLAEPASRPRRSSLVALGGGAAGAAVMGVLALGAAPANAPTLSPRVPATTVSQAQPASILVHTRRGYLP